MNSLFSAFTSKDNNTLNDYLTARNKQFYRGHSNAIHPLYETELKNAIAAITDFIDSTVLKQAYFQRKKKLFSFVAENCYSNTKNNYSFSEAEACEELIFDKDPIINNLENFKKEVEVRIQDSWEKNVKYEKSILNENFTPEKFDKLQRKFLNHLNYFDRYYYYFVASNLFLSTKETKNFDPKDYEYFNDKQSVSENY